jgi:DNA-binding CsgD family transcriptional regulator
MSVGNEMTSAEIDARAGLYGRDQELGTLDDLLRRARGGHGGTWEIRGTVGMGKTALLAATGAADFLVLRIRGTAREKALPWAGLNQLLRPVAEHVRLLPPGPAAALGPVINCEITDSPENPAPTHVFSVYSALTRLLSEVAQEKPVLCCADDVQWLDPISRDGLLFAAQRLAEAPIVLLLAGPPETTAGFPGFGLGPLCDEASRRVLDHHVPDRLPKDLADELISLSSGIPLALVELARSLTIGQLAGTAPPPVSLPRTSSLRDHLRRRFAQLTPDAQWLVRLTVADEGIDVNTVVRAAAACGVDVRALAEATASGLVQDDGEVVDTPNRLVRSSIYADTPLAERHAAHELLAKVLDDEQYRLRALTHRAATAPSPNERLASELDAAASTARRSRDYEASARGYQQAATLTLDSTRKALRLLSAARDFWLAGRTQRSRTLVRQVRPLTCDTAVRGMADLLQGEIELRDGAPAVGHQRLLQAAEELAESHLQLAVTALMRAGEAGCAVGNYNGYFSTAQRATTLSHPGESPLLQLMFDHFEGLSATLLGQHVQAHEPLSRVVKLAESLPGCAPKTWASLAALVIGEDARAHELAAQAVNSALGDGNAVLAPWALEFLAHSALRLDHYSSAVTASVDGLRLAQVAGQHNCAINHLTMLALVAALLGDKETTLLRLQTAADEAAARGLARPTSMSSWALACLDLAEDRPGDALERLRPAITGTDRSNSSVRIVATPQFVEAAVRCDERAAAIEALVTFDDWARSTMNPAYLALSQRCQALLADETEADERFREALRLHRNGDRPFELAKTELFYGERLRRNRKPGAARKYLRNARTTFQRYEATYWADRARAELRAAGDAVDPAARAADLDLTPQQAQISRLVAEGATNREIAAQLFLSPRTVEHHLRNIFAKLGIRSRVELTTLFR